MSDIMAESSRPWDIEKDVDDSHRPTPRPKLVVQPFAGRLGGNQEFILDRSISVNAVILQEIPDAAPGMSLAEQFDLRPFRTFSLWKAAALEAIGTVLCLTQ
jgi:hypothetical protein